MNENLEKTIVRQGSLYWLSYICDKFMQGYARVF